MKFKLIILVILLSLISINVYFSHKFPDTYTQLKIQLSSLKGSTNYLGRLNFWRLLVQNNDWDNAASLESKINPTQVENYKLSYQPQQLQTKLSQLNNQKIKTADDYLKLAQIQSLLGQSSQAIESIKKAHQLDPIRSDIDRLFYQITQ
jgi:hypothetical protein